MISTNVIEDVSTFYFVRMSRVARFTMAPISPLELILLMMSTRPASNSSFRVLSICCKKYAPKTPEGIFDEEFVEDAAGAAKNPLLFQGAKPLPTPGPTDLMETTAELPN